MFENVYFASGNNFNYQYKTSTTNEETGEVVQSTQKENVRQRLMYDKSKKIVYLAENEVVQDGTDADGVYSATYIPYQVGESEIMYFEAGLGVFSVLHEDWTLNLEAVFGNYDWHNSASIKGAIGWQPNDWFALNLYAKTSFYDSADDKDLGLYWMEPDIGFDSLQKIGSARVDNSSETSIGVQAIFQF